MIVESLPRSESSLMSVKLGSLFLRDLTTQGTIFPVLVSPKTVSRVEQGVYDVKKSLKNELQLLSSLFVIYIILDFMVYHAFNFLTSVML